MKIWNFTKNIMLSILITSLYAIWSKEELHEVSTFRMWLILILVFLLVLHLFVWVDREIRRIRFERAKKYLRKEKTNELQRIKTSKWVNYHNRH